VNAAKFFSMAASRLRGAVYLVLVPNMKATRPRWRPARRDVAVFAAASQAFSQRNINSVATRAPVEQLHGMGTFGV